MIFFFSENKFYLTNNKLTLKKWIKEIIKSEKKSVGNINIVFYDDEQLLKLNERFLKHKTLTDIITFDYSENDVLHGDICISTERVKENAEKYECTFDREFERVIAHGILHLCGYKDKKKEDKIIMKQKEEDALSLLDRLYN